MCQKNVLTVFDQADAMDRSIALESWWKYQRLTSEVAAKYGYPSHIGAAVFAALSPNNSYHGNLRDTDRLLCTVKGGGTLDDFKVSTYGNNKRKAWAIAHGEDPLEHLRFPKTRSFYLNIKDPHDPDPVTVDGHVYNIWRGRRIPLKSAAHKMKISLYPIIAEDIRQVARRLGMIPNQVQAVCWIAWRRMHGIQTSLQLDLWDGESLAAGLGWFISENKKAAPTRSSLAA